MDHHHNAWTDRHISSFDELIIYITVVLLLLFPLIPYSLAKGRASGSLSVLYPVVILVASIILLFLSFEKRRLMSVDGDGMRIRYTLQTWDKIKHIGWEDIREITVVNSWIPRNYARLFRGKGSMAAGIGFRNIVNPTMLIIEARETDTTDRLYFVEVVDVKGFLSKMNALLTHPGGTVHTRLTNYT